MMYEGGFSILFYLLFSGSSVPPLVHFLVCLSVVFASRYSILAPSLFSFVKSCVSILGFICVIIIRLMKRKVSHHSSPFPFECIRSPSFFENSDLCHLPFFMFLLSQITPAYAVSLLVTLLIVL